MKLALLVEKEEQNYLPYLKPILAGHQVSVIFRCPELVSELTDKFEGVIFTREDFLKKLTFGAKGSSIENYAGSLFEKHGKPLVCVDPIKQLVTTRTGEFLSKRYISKILKPEEWFKESKFTWEVAREHTVDSLFEHFSTANLIAIDIETPGKDLAIACTSYCGVWFDNNGNFTTHCIVLPFTSMFWVHWVRKFNTLPCPKIFQNGLFDNLYFLRFGCPVINWAFDTQELFHSWYSELPKRLDAISAFLIRKVVYWKEDGKTGNLEDYYRYNAMDGWATANSWLSLLVECPDWAIANYVEKFPLVFPCLTVGFDGIKVNQETAKKMGEVQEAKLEESLGKLRKRIGRPEFNPNSPKQVLSLLHAIGYEKETKIKKYIDGKPVIKDSSGEKVLAKIRTKHPIPQMLIDSILQYREASKLLSTYIDATLLNGRLLYSLAPSGTDTGRLASKQSSFYEKVGSKMENYGAQTQNLPEYFKEALEADDGFYLFEIDNKNSEGFCVGYLSGDTNLIATLTSGKDFHCANAERFFGIPYAELFDDATQKVLNKIIRNLAKRVNHGANYNMAETVLIETMGIENVLKAKELLKLPAEWNLYRVAEYLLARYAESYPDVKGVWYEYIVACIKLTHTLVSALGWTRYCFGEPWKNKPDLNAYVAHAPQNLSVGIINRGFRRCFNEIQMREWKNFRLKAQIHDSIFGQYRIGRLDLVKKANELVKQAVPVTDARGITRTMRIPTDVKAEGKIWSQLTNVNKLLLAS